MKNKPIGPKLHGAIDYGFAALQMAGPSLFGLQGSARTISYAFAGTQGLLNTFTNHPLALKRLVPLKVHKAIEIPFLSSIVVLPLITGAMKKNNARWYFLSFFGIALANYLLSDYNAYEKEEKKKLKKLKKGRLKPIAKLLKVA